MEKRENVRLKLADAYEWHLRLAVARQFPEGVVLMEGQPSAAIRRMNRLGLLRRVGYPMVTVRGRRVRRPSYTITPAGVQCMDILKAGIQKSLAPNAIFVSVPY